jgi:probable HAF family extracellular repeat protein
MTNIRKVWTKSITSGTYFLCFLLLPATHAAELIPLGILPGNEFSTARDVSDDGTVVVGENDGPPPFGRRAFRWTAESGMVALEDLPSGRHPFHAYGVSVDGSVVVGDARIDLGDHESYRWALADGMEGLGSIHASITSSQAHATSADGNVVVGRSIAPGATSPGQGSNHIEAFRWTSAGGMVGLGTLSDNRLLSHAYGVSADGNVVVGYSDSASGTEAFRWTSEGGMVGLGDLPGGDFRSEAMDASADGKVIVGNGSSALGQEAFIWTSEGGMVGLGDLPGGDFHSEAIAVSADGSVVVGNSRTGSHDHPGWGTVHHREGFVWTQANGMLRLEDILVANGTTGLSGWSWLQVEGISDNGKWIVGEGTYPSDYGEAFVVRLPDSIGEGFTINAGLNDAWFNASTPGQGFLIAVFPVRKEVFLAWFTYDTERPPEDVTALLGEPGHRWLTAQGPYDGDTANLTIFVTEGGVFDAAEPAATTDPAGDGTMTIEFADCTEGLVSYEITSLGISGEIPIQRIALDNVALCEALASP